jgi:ORF6N domain
MSNKTKIAQKEIENRILTVRGEQVMLDKDLAEMYQTETKYINRALKRNGERFPESFVFQITQEEWEYLKFQPGTSKTHGGRRTLPYAFTEQGVAMLSAVLHTEIAVKVSIQIINAFVQMRKLIGQDTIQQLRFYNLENKLIEHDQKFEEVFKALESKQLPQKGIFYDGHVFDAYSFIADLIRKAAKSIVLIDNYIDDSVFTLFTKRKPGVSCTCYTKSITKSLKLDIEKHNQQYPPIEIKELKTAHDRFLIIDEKELYHIGASLKDLGKKWFAFSKMDVEMIQMLEKLKSGKSQSA